MGKGRGSERLIGIDSWKDLFLQHTVRIVISSKTVRTNFGSKSRVFTNQNACTQSTSCSQRYVNTPVQNIIMSVQNIIAGNF